MGFIKTLNPAFLPVYSVTWVRLEKDVVVEAGIFDMGTSGGVGTDVALIGWTADDRMPIDHRGYG